MAKLKLLYNFILIFSLITSSLAIWLQPAILDPPPGMYKDSLQYLRFIIIDLLIKVHFYDFIASKPICFNQVIENSQAPDSYNPSRPYISCMNEATIKIQSATLSLATSNSCPLLFTNLAAIAPPTCNGNNYANSNVTTILNNM